MKNFSYYRPTTVEQAVGLLDAKWGTAELLAGGTDLHDLQKEYVAQPDKVISLAGLGGAFRQIAAAGRAVTIGAGVRLAEIAESKELAAYPALTAAAYDEDGFYRMGDAVRYLDPARPEAGLLFDGRVAEDFKLSTGTWESAS